MTVEHEAARIPRGSAVRRLTASIEDARAGRGLGAVVQEVWYVAVTVGLSVLFVTGIADSIRGTVTTRPGAVTLTGELPAALVVLVVAGALVSLAGRMGPVGLGGGGAAWWLPMPVDRRGLLRPTVLKWPLVSAGAGAVVAPLCLLLFGTDVSVSSLAEWAALGAAGFALLAGGAALLQRLGRASRVLAVAGDLVMLVAAVAIAGVALTGQDVSGWTLDGAWPTAAVLALGAVVTTVLAERHSDRLSGAGLRDRGSVGDRAQVAVLSLDLRELSGALTVAPGKVRRRGSLRLAAGGARRAVVLADLVLAARAPRQVAQVLVAALFAVAAGRVALTQSGLPLYGVWLVTGFWAANAAAAGARHADLAPVLDRLLPLSARDVRVARGAVPLLAATVWTLAAAGAQALSGGDALWLALAPPWAAVLAAAAVRGAYRPPPRWVASTLASPMGGVPPTGGLFKGLDVALVGTLPTAITLYIGRLTEPLVIAQWVLAAVVVTFLVLMTGRAKKVSSGGTARR